MIGKNTEKAIKAWLALPIDERRAAVEVRSGRVRLWREGYDLMTLFATYTPQQVIAKRYPKRKAAKKVKR